MTPPDDANDAKPDYPVSDYPLSKLGSKSASISSASSVFLSPSADEDDDWQKKKTKKENKNNRTEEQETILIERNNLILRHYIEKDGKKTKERTEKKPF